MKNQKEITTKDALLRLQRNFAKCPRCNSGPTMSQYSETKERGKGLSLPCECDSCGLIWERVAQRTPPCMLQTIVVKIF